MEALRLVQSLTICIYIYEAQKAETVLSAVIYIYIYIYIYTYINVEVESTLA